MNWRGLLGRDQTSQMTKGDELDPHQKEGLATLILQFEDMFSSIPGITKVLKHDIELIAETSVRSRSFRLS